MLIIDPHPLLDAVTFETTFSGPLVASSPELLAFLSESAAVPLSSGDDVRSAVRDLLRKGGFKPTGRSKPASEYVLNATREGRLSGINIAVDICNIVSLHSGLPISVIDLDKATPPFQIGVCPMGVDYVFNASGQSIDIGGLLCLNDALGPCANAVKDAQRTKTDADTRRTLTVIWGTKALPERSQRAFQWYKSLLEQHDAVVTPIGA